jgi:hypothetical protein
MGPVVGLVVGPVGVVGHRGSLGVLACGVVERCLCGSWGWLLSYSSWYEEESVAWVVLFLGEGGCGGTVVVAGLPVVLVLVVSSRVSSTSLEVILAGFSGCARDNVLVSSVIGLIDLGRQVVAYSFSN